MVNFFGIFHRDGKRLHLTGANLEPSPTGKCSVCFLGTLHEPEEWASQLGVERRNLSQAALFLRAFEHWGPETFKRVKGEYSCIIWDEEKNELLLVRDRVGVYPLYFTETPHEVIFASTIKALVRYPKVSRSPNLNRLEQYGNSRPRREWQPEATCFSQVFRVLPSHARKFTPNGDLSFQYWDFSVDETVAKFSPPEALDAFRDSYTRAVKRRVQTPGGVAVALSGGLGSSSIFARSMQQASNCLGISLGHPAFRTEDESRFLRDLQKFLECNVRTVLPDNIDFDLDHVRRGIFQTETPRYDASWLAWNSVCEATRQSGRSVLLSGHWGDQILSPPHFRSQIFRRGLDSLRQLLGKDGGKFGRSCYGQWLYQAVRDPKQVETMEWFQKVGMENGAEFRFPMLDVDLITLLFSLPGAIQNSGRVPYYLLRETMKNELPDSIRMRHGELNPAVAPRSIVREQMQQIVSHLEEKSWMLELQLVTPSQLNKRLTLWKKQLKKNKDVNSHNECWEWFGIETWCSLFLGESV